MRISNRIPRVCVLTVALAVISSAAAIAADTVDVSNPWVRATVAGQEVAGAYMDGHHSKGARRADRGREPARGQGRVAHDGDGRRCDENEAAREALSAGEPDRQS